MSGVRMASRSRHVSDCAASALPIDEAALEQLAQRADGDVPGDRPQREDAVGLPVAGHHGDRRRRPRCRRGHPRRPAAASGSGPGRPGRPARRSRPAWATRLIGLAGPRAGSSTWGASPLRSTPAPARSVSRARGRGPWLRRGESRVNSRRRSVRPRRGRRASRRCGPRSSGSRPAGARSGRCCHPPARSGARRRAAGRPRRRRGCEVGSSRMTSLSRDDPSP